MGQLVSIPAETHPCHRGPLGPQGAGRPHPWPKYQSLYHKALLRPRHDSGTAYSCSQATINETINPSYNLNRTNAVSLRDAAREVVEHNDENRSPAPDSLEAQAIERLDRLFHLPSRALLGPDLLYKTFRDFDAVFYNGRLFGQVEVRWWAGNGTQDTFGYARRIRPRKAEIVLNAETIFGDLTRTGLPPDPYLQMFRAIVHEMAHALEFVRTSDAAAASECNHPGGHQQDCDVFCNGQCGHGPYFRTILHSIHRRSKRLGWFRVISRIRDYKQRHFRSREWENETALG
ncbi:MAG: hypothetical protein Q9163_004191, partial [Psora crenata]